MGRLISACALLAVAEALVRPQVPDARTSAHQETGRRATLALGSAFALAGLAAGPGRATAAAAPPAGASKSARAGAAFETPAVRGLDRPEEQQVVRNFKKLPSGVRYADLKEGTGPELTPGSIAVCQWVLRRADGYFVDSSEKHDFAPIRLKLGAAELGAVDDALVGMRQGGARRILVPLAVAGSAAQLSKKLELGFGPARQLERQFNRQDPYNLFYYEISLDKIQSGAK